MDFQVIVQNSSFLVLQGFFGIGGFAGGTLRLAVPAIALGFALGTAIALARLARARWLSLAAAVYVEFFRGVPLVMVIFWFWFIIPTLLGTSLPEYAVALTAFVVFEAAYLAEIVRSGIQSVPRGQMEAATATGLKRAQMLRHIVLPQALRHMIPALVTQFIVLLKDTSLASIIGYVDLTKAAQIVNNREIRPFELYLFIALIYWLCSYGMSRYARYWERRLEPSTSAPA
jgi:His/Glu/Gln/Arg/opine family amino acid ABC transporter permease subunit